MSSAPPICQDPGCEIAHEKRCLHATVGPGLADAVQECYRTLANECLVRQCNRILVIGILTKSVTLIAVYDAAMVEAGRLGLEARRLVSEEYAERWLRA